MKQAAHIDKTSQITSHIVETSIHAMSISHRAQVEAIQSVHTIILGERETEHNLSQSRLKKEIKEQPL